jgi:bifunctional enzyme CysN/CysC
VKSINIMTCGSVDDGKSTLLGRLIFETNNLLEDQSDYLIRLNQKYSKKDIEIDYSLLLDGLIDEKEQGITIDIAFKYFVLGNTNFTLIDSPGHKEYTKNMANAATFADVALILIDASKGVTQQTKKHIEIVNMFPNIKNKIICINKMDKLKYSKTSYFKIKKDIESYVNRNQLLIDEILPISAVKGDNVIKKSPNMKFYKGKTLYEHLTSLTIKSSLKNNGNTVVRFVDNSTTSRTYFVENNEINYKVGDILENVYTGEKTAVKTIFHNNKSIKNQKNLKNTSLRLKDPISISKGDSLVLENQNAKVSDAFKAKIIWTGTEELLRSKRYLFKFHSKSEYGFISKSSRKKVNINSISILNIELENKSHIDTYRTNYKLSQLVIIDPEINSTVGFGFITQNIDRGSTVIYKNLQNINKNIYKCIWLTGIPSSGKSTIAEALGRRLKKLKIPYYIIDGDNIRSTLNKDLGFTKEDRIENNRRVAHLAKILFESGVVPIVATVSPNKSSRSFARSLFKNNEFLLVYVYASLETCMGRDPKNLYSNKFKKVKNITGLHTNYDVPTDANLVLDTEELSVTKSVNRLLKILIPKL